jgi:uncharacterized protein YodC (DUF2158 family)
MENFIIGDIVQLKSGGPKMTIEALSTTVFCQWFNEKNELCDGHFQENTLKKVKEENYEL